MAQNTPPVRLDRATLTKTHLRATEIMLYRMADLIDRLLAGGGIPYTKLDPGEVNGGQ